MNSILAKIICFLIGISLSTFAQSKSQIDKAKRIMEKKGMSKAEARSLAKAKGYSDSQINNAFTKSSSDNPKTSNSSSLEKATTT